MAVHSNLGSLFSDIADAIRNKTGSSSEIVADNFPSAIASIPTGSAINPTLAERGQIAAGATKTLDTDCSSGDYVCFCCGQSNIATATDGNAYAIKNGVATALYEGGQANLVMTMSNGHPRFAASGTLVKNYLLIKLS